MRIRNRHHAAQLQLHDGATANFDDVGASSSTSRVAGRV